jgi:ABC-type uncharacterized transport system auxiliary subunit
MKSAVASSLVAVIAAASLLSGCAAPQEGDQVNTFNEQDVYTPTGSNIPRKTLDKDGKRIVLSKGDAQKMVQDL